jgi:DNA-binding transcriptional MerR regulator
LVRTSGEPFPTTFGKHRLSSCRQRKLQQQGLPLDTNQETLSLREARSQKRKATSPTPHEDDLDQEIRNMEMLHQKVQQKKEKMARLADLQRQIDEASKEVRHLAQDEQN